MSKKEEAATAKPATESKPKEVEVDGRKAFLAGEEMPPGAPGRDWMNAMADTVRTIAALQRAQLGRGTEDDQDAHELVERLDHVSCPSS